MVSEVALLHQLGREIMPMIDRSQVVYVLVEARPTELVAQVRMPLNFALVLDCSGSMNGKKQQSVKEAVKGVIDHLSLADAIAVVTFNSQAQTIIPSQPASDPQKMKASVETIKSRGGTNMARGMQQGLDEIARWENSNMIKRMILLTDGRTLGSNKCRQLARNAQEFGVVIYSLGIGADWDEKLLDEIGLLSVEPHSAGLFRIAQSELSYDVPALGLMGQRVHDDIIVTFRSDAMQTAQVNAVVMNSVEKINAFRLVSKVLDEYRQTGKTTTHLAPNVTRVLDAETQKALEQIQQGQQISQEQVKSIGNKTRKLTQRLDWDP